MTADDNHYPGPSFGIFCGVVAVMLLVLFAYSALSGG